jgi:hypothetical protein
MTNKTTKTGKVQVRLVFSSTTGDDNYRDNKQAERNDMGARSKVRRWVVSRLYNVVEV